MKRGALSTAVLILGVMIGTCVPAEAAAGFFIGPYLGYSTQKPSLDGVRFNTDTSSLYGARFGFKLLMVSIEANYLRIGHTIGIDESAAGDWAGMNLNMQYLGLNAKVFFPLLIIHPYVTAGYGFYTADVNTVGKDTQRGINLGLGMEIHLGGKFSLLAEGKYHRVRFDIQERSLKLGNYSLAGGFNIYF